MPRGRWYDPATGELFDGPREVEVDAPLARIPVLARAGAALPVAGADGGHGAGGVGAGTAAARERPADSGRRDGWDRSPTVRLIVRECGGEIVVTRHDGTPADYPVRVRG